MELTYPISRNYVPDWDAVRAAAELVSNALDEDERAELTYRDGRTVISDRGPGMTGRNLVLGETGKTAAEIGQFGEGAKIALLVLAREHREPVIETGGVWLTAHIEPRNLGWSGEDPVDVLVLRTTTGTRRNGTRASFAFTADEHQDLRRRFLRYDTPRYRRPTETGRVLPDRPGHLYIGGVLIALREDLRLGYDLHLGTAKHLLGRDRDVVDGWELSRLIGKTIGACTDPDAVTSYVRSVLDGTVTAPERNLSGKLVTNEQTNRAWRAARRKLLPGERLYWDDRDSTDAARLRAADDGWQLIPCATDPELHRTVMRRLRIRHLDEIVVAKAKVRWVSTTNLLETERRNLSLAKRRVRRLLGHDAIPRCRIFEQHDDPGCVGEYDPDNDIVTLRRDQLDDPVSCAGTLLHELAHREARRRGMEWWDRTRGFESVLTEFAGRALIGGPHQNG